MVCKRVLLFLLFFASLAVPAATFCTNVTRRSGASMPRSRFVVLTRAYEPELPYYEAWLNHHLALGFDSILLLDMTRAGLGEMCVSDPARVFVHRSTMRTADIALQGAGRGIISSRAAEWVLVADIDEYLLLNRPSIGAYVEAVEATHGRVDFFQFRWANVLHFKFRCRPQNLASHVRAAGGAYPSPVIKTMSRIGAGVTGLGNPHHPKLRSASTSRYAIYADGRYRNVSKKMVMTAVIEPSTIALQKPLYRDAVLVHLHTRSIANQLAKAALTKHADKAASVVALRRVVQQPASVPPRELLAAYVKAVGLTAAYSLWMVTKVARVDFAAIDEMYTTLRVERMFIESSASETARICNAREEELAQGIYGSGLEAYSARLADAYEQELRPQAHSRMGWDVAW
jgi:hypothetical protein